MLLADAAQAVGGKLYILGGGWSVIGPDATPFALAVKIEVPWDQTNVRHTAVLALLDADGQPIMVDTGEQTEPIQVEIPFEVGRPPGLKPGTPIDVPLAINFGPIPLEAGTRFVWRLTIDDRSESEWHVAFNTRPRGDGPSSG